MSTLPADDWVVRPAYLLLALNLGTFAQTDKNSHRFLDIKRKPTNCPYLITITMLISNLFTEDFLSRKGRFEHNNPPAPVPLREES